MVNVGIVGTGVISHEHAAAIASSGGRLKLTAAADTAAERLSAFCDAACVGRRYGDAAELIADPEVGLVVIATPPSTHEALTLAALEAGKRVLCEKPLAHSLASAQRIAQADAQHPGKLSVGYQQRYHPAFRRLKRLAREGWLGDLRSAIVERHGAIPHAEHGKAGWWGAWRVAGGGVLVTQMIHELDLLIQVMGMPQSVSAIADTRFTGIESEDYLEARLTYADGRIVDCVGSVNSGTQGGGFLVEGSGGSATLAGDLDLFDPARQAAAERAARGWAQGAASAHTAFYLDIADAIERGAALPVPPSEAMASLQLCMAAYQSAITGRPAQLPLCGESLVWAGVSCDDWEARRCRRDAPSLFLTPPAIAKETMQGRLKREVKHRLAAAGVELPVVKAMIHKPPQVNGGPKTRVRAWPSRKTFGREEKRAVMRLMDREMLEGDQIRYAGDQEQAYCAEFCQQLGGGYADAVNAGTNAMYVALRALDLEPGSEVVCAPVTDAGCTMPIAVANLIPVVADAAPRSILPSVDQVGAVITERTSAIVVAHIAGHAVDLDPILALAAERGLPVIEDCAQAHGTLYKGRHVGTFGDIAAFSTMYLKNHATGGQGGVVYTRDPRHFVRIRQVADRGKPFGVLGPVGNVLASLNFNQDEISMAIGRVQLKKLAGQVESRRAFAASIDAGLRDLPEVSVIGDPPHSHSSYHFVMLRLDVDTLGCTVEEFVGSLAEDGIGGASPYKVYPTDGPWYRNAAVFGASGQPWSLRPEAPAPAPFALPNARECTRTMFRIDLHRPMGAAEARDVVKAVRKAVVWRRSKAPVGK